MSKVITKEVNKPEKVCLCRECSGTGYIGSKDVVWPIGGKAFNVCPQCGGTGRVRVTAHMTLTIKPL